jgi:microcystin-dependent protein
MAAEPYLGQIQSFSFDFTPRGWAYCAGQTMSITTNQALFALLGTTYGGNGVTTFQLPNLQGRSVRGYGVGGGGLSPCNMGQVNGTESVTLNILQMPSHIHTLTSTPGAAAKASSADGIQPNPSAGVETLGVLNDSSLTATNNFYNNLAPDTNLNTGSQPYSLANSGGNQPFSIMQPFLVINYCIALQGIFPSRN